ncbi:TetR/AcrR family transcriptional regulator [Rhizobium sullae]|uniref:TetR/AcrR family transcriptional regulator n=1 Tax=Rhizobium sullae TaxID=50338 RepID=UPI000B35E0B9|nr:TetR/AcrR family transcriptional regulator [Rhizobium sullae]
MNDRLAKSDWIDHGLRTLAERGPNALKIGAMAEGLNVSRGSFYWHFRDVADFRTQLLQHWRDWTTQRVIRELEADLDEPDRLRSLVSSAFAGEPGNGRTIRSLDKAVRAWAIDSDEVAAVVASVDADRVAYIARLLVESGVESEKAAYRASFLYWAYLGQPIAMNPDFSSATSTAIADICELFRR